MTSLIFRAFQVSSSTSFSFLCVYTSYGHRRRSNSYDISSFHLRSQVARTFSFKHTTVTHPTNRSSPKHLSPYYTLNHNVVLQTPDCSSCSLRCIGCADWYRAQKAERAEPEPEQYYGTLVCGSSLEQSDPARPDLQHHRFQNCAAHPLGPWGSSDG
jgi:hypothetical protein